MHKQCYKSWGRHAKCWVLKCKQFLTVRTLGGVFSFCKSSPLATPGADAHSRACLPLRHGHEWGSFKESQSSALGSWEVSGYEGTPCLIKHSVPPLRSPEQLGYKLHHHVSLLHPMVGLNYKGWVTLQNQLLGKASKAQQAEELTPEKILL